MNSNVLRDPEEAVKGWEDVAGSNSFIMFALREYRKAASLEERRHAREWVLVAIRCARELRERSKT